MSLPRIILRPLQAQDGAAFVAAVRASRTLHRPWVQAPADAGAFARWHSRFDGQAHHGMLVCCAESGELAGSINLTQIVRGGFQSGYLGYFAFVRFAGQGYMQAGLQAMVRHAFGPLRLHRLEANIQPGNTASIALVQRCGFQREGFSPRYLKIGGRWRDHERWAIVKA